MSLGREIMKLQKTRKSLGLMVAILETASRTNAGIASTEYVKGRLWMLVCLDLIKVKSFSLSWCLTKRSSWISTDESFIIRYFYIVNLVLKYQTKNGQQSFYITFEVVIITSGMRNLWVHSTEQSMTNNDKKKNWNRNVVQTEVTSKIWKTLFVAYVS